MAKDPVTPPPAPAGPKLVTVRPTVPLMEDGVRYEPSEDPKLKPTPTFQVTEARRAELGIYVEDVE